MTLGGVDGVTTRIEFGAVTSRVPLFGGTGLVSRRPSTKVQIPLEAKRFCLIVTSS
jgi:hypothetical protein